MSGFQSLPSLALYCLMTGSFLVVWAVHTLYQPVWREGKGKLDLNGETDLPLPKDVLVPCGWFLMQEKVPGWEKERILLSRTQKAVPCVRMTKLRGSAKSTAARKPTVMDLSLDTWTIAHLETGWNSDWWKHCQSKLLFRNVPGVWGYIDFGGEPALCIESRVYLVFDRACNQKTPDSSSL